MKIYLFSLLAASLLIFTSCKDEEDENPNENIQKHYQGNWEITGNQVGFDTTFVMAINVEGDFDASTELGGETANLEGSVDNEGTVDGSINSHTQIVGTITGKLNTSGTGSGTFVMLPPSGETYNWTATKL